MNRLSKLKECLDIARKFKNPDMESHLLREIEKEKEQPSDVTYPE